MLLFILFIYFKSLFRNLPNDFTINLLLEVVYDVNTKNSRLHEMEKHLKRMLEWTTKKSVSQFNASIMKQTDGVALGTPIAPLLGDICVIWVIRKTLALYIQPKVFSLCRRLSSSIFKS